VCIVCKKCQKRVQCPLQTLTYMFAWPCESTNTETSRPNLFNFVRVLSDVSFPLFSLFFPTNSAKCLEQSSMLFHVLKRENLKTTVIKMKEQCIKPYNNSGSSTLLRPQIQREVTKYWRCLQPWNLA